MRTFIITLLALLGSGAHATGPVLPETASPYSLSETVDRVKDAIESHNLRLLPEQDLPGTQTPARTVYFCDFDLLERTYRVDRRIGHELPCRITVLQRAGGVVFSAVNPEHLAQAAGLEASQMCRGHRGPALSRAARLGRAVRRGPVGSPSRARRASAPAYHAPGRRGSDRALGAAPHPVRATDPTVPAACILARWEADLETIITAATRPQ
jgi:uncharacterized protein (DUF302 family)